jgi:hypothetical protein
LVFQSLLANIVFLGAKEQARWSQSRGGDRFILPLEYSHIYINFKNLKRIYII